MRWFLGFIKRVLKLIAAADQVKSKYVRIMQEFELFRSVSDFLGPIRNASEEKAWEKLLTERPKNAQQLRQFRETGFAHADDCQRIVGAARSYAS